MISGSLPGGMGGRVTRDPPVSLEIFDRWGVRFRNDDFAEPLKILSRQNPLRHRCRK
jgi:hypothetical protein